MPKHLVRVASLKCYKILCEQYKINYEEIMKSLNLDPTILSNLDYKISYLTYAKLLKRSADLACEPYFGIKLAQMNGLNLLAPITLGLQLQPTLNDALLFFIEHVHIQAEGLNINIELSSNSIAKVIVTYEFVDETNYDCLRQATCQYLFNYTNLINKIEGYELYDTDRIFICLKQKAKEGVKKPYYIKFNQSFNGLEIPVALLSKEMNFDKNQFFEYINQELLVLKTSANHTFAKSVTSTIKQSLEISEECSIEFIASRFNMSPRTLQNRLKLEETSYSLLLQKVRNQYARQQLRDLKTPVTTIAFKLGFSDVSVFSRMFKRWNGLSPAAWRKALISETKTVD